jgi:hypothetical protein
MSVAESAEKSQTTARSRSNGQNRSDQKVAAGIEEDGGSSPWVAEAWPPATVDVAWKLGPHGEHQDGVADLLEHLMAEGDGHRVVLVGELWRADGDEDGHAVSDGPEENE